MRIKIIQKGWTGFSGSMGTMKFKDGMAETTPIEARRIGALVQVVECDENGFELDPVSDSHAMVMTRKMSATVTEALKTGDEDPVEPEAAKPEPADTLASEAGERVAGEAKPVVVLAWDREKLEALAGEKGINALREIATPLNIRGTRISALIDGILEAQAQAKA